MYFPAALLIKSSLTILLLTLLAPFLFVRGLLPYRRELVFLGAGVLVFLGACMTSDLNIGVRHVLPVYPFAAVLAGACALGDCKVIEGRSVCRCGGAAAPDGLVAAYLSQLHSICQ